MNFSGLTHPQGSTVSVDPLIRQSVGSMSYNLLDSNRYELALKTKTKNHIEKIGCNKINKKYASYELAEQTKIFYCFALYSNYKKKFGKNACNGSIKQLGGGKVTF